MRPIHCDFQGTEANLLPIGDVHVGDQAFKTKGREKLAGYLRWAREHEDNTRIFLLGDIFNVATRLSKTSPFEGSSTEYEEGLHIFEPYRDLIIGAIDGNHEARLREFAGFSPTESFCRELKVPYCGWSSLLTLRVGARDGNRFRQTYHIYIHHTTGGGKSLGSALARIEALERIVRGCDVYLGGHNHQLVTGARDVWEPSVQARKPILRRINYASCGSYLDWEHSYAEKGMMPPAKLGSPRIKFGGGLHPDVHISI